MKPVIDLLSTWNLTSGTKSLARPPMPSKIVEKTPKRVSTLSIRAIPPNGKDVAVFSIGKTGKKTTISLSIGHLSKWQSQVTDKYWLLVRPSNTEPILKLNVEAGTLDDARGLMKKYRRIAEDCVRKTR